MPCPGKRVLAFAVVSALIGALASAAPAVTDPGDLVIDPAQVAAKAAQATTLAAVQFGGAVIDSGVVTADTIARMKAHFGGKINPEDLRIKDADSPNERAIKTFLSAINGRLVACGGKLAMKVPINMTSPDERQDLGTIVLPVLTDGIYVVCVTSPDSLPSGAESVQCRFIISLHKSYFAGSEIDPLWDDEMFRWKEFP